MTDSNHTNCGIYRSKLRKLKVVLGLVLLLLKIIKMLFEVFG